MAIPLDSLTARHSGVPPPAPLAMPEQNLERAASVHFARPATRTRLARLVTFGGSLALTVYAGYQMILIVSPADVTALQWLMTALFVITFGWIALAACGALAGLLPGREARRAPPDAAPISKTALLMPVYNEDPARAFAALRAMGSELAQSGLGKHFEIFVISDTTDPEIWIRETAAVLSLRESLGQSLYVWYRRRHENRGKKAGNVHDFVTRWGQRYDYMIVLDADSLLSGAALAAMVREMQADPDCGILQSLPRLYDGKTLFARLQQFAGTVYGPVVARGITAWQGDDGNYWGHNAIIRVTAFAAAAGLPTLPGRKPFGGEILSHDFVEAALVRRAGWSVRMLPALEGSWEESPPSLLDVASRDRRWAQGNLQHLGVVTARGLRWPNRAHMLIGVMSYLSSPLWLALIVVGLIITAQAATAGFDYFTQEFQLFPNWPIFDSERMIDLFIVTMGILLLPKGLGLLHALANTALRKQLGVMPLVCSVFVETAVSVFYAPIFMLIQSQQIWEILRGKDSGWSVQQRARRAAPWGTLAKRHAWHTIAGLVISAALVYVSVPLLAWMAPTLIGLVLAVPLSALSGSIVLANRLRGLRLLRIPEEVTRPPIMAARDRFERQLRAEVDHLTLETLVHRDLLHRRHFAAVPAPAAPAPGNPDIHRASAALKIADAEHVDEAVAWLSNDERLALLSHPGLFEQLLQLGAGTHASETHDPSAGILVTGTAGHRDDAAGSSPSGCL